MAPRQGVTSIADESGIRRFHVHLLRHTWATKLHRRDLVPYDKGIPVLCAACVGDAFVEMLPRR